LQKSLSVMEGAPNRGVPEPFMRSGRKRFEWSVKGKPVRARRRSKTPTPPANFGDPKRVKRHEARHSPGPPGEKPMRPESDVELGCSFFEKWVVRQKVRRIS